MAAALLATATARAETVYVADSANVLSDPSSASTTLLIAPKGTAMTVLSRQDDWIQIQTKDAKGNQVTGWVFGTQVQNSAPGGFDFSGAFGGGNAGASEATATAAGKGLSPNALDFAKTQNLDPKFATEMETQRSAVTNAMWEAFRVTPDAPGGKLGKGR